LALVRVVNLRRSLEGLQKMGFWLVGAEVKGEGNLFDFSFPGRAVVVLGSEGRGLAPLTRRTCDFLVAVPHRREEVSSLNVSVAGELFLAEYYRQVGGRVERLQERVSKRLFVRCQAGRG
jgi:23S rRNA (guanosine2251-2'-O)-methyltransferase